MMQSDNILLLHSYLLNLYSIALKFEYDGELASEAEVGLPFQILRS